MKIKQIVMVEHLQYQLKSKAVNWKIISIVLILPNKIYTSDGSEISVFIVGILPQCLFLQTMNVIISTNKVQYQFLQNQKKSDLSLQVEKLSNL